MKPILTLMLMDAATIPEPSLTQIWIQLPMVAVVVFLWIRGERRQAAQDRVRDERERARDEQYAALVHQVVQVVTDNAAASAGLRQALADRPCMARGK